MLLLLSICVYGVDVFFFFQAEDGIRDLVRSRGLGDVYKRQGQNHAFVIPGHHFDERPNERGTFFQNPFRHGAGGCLLYTSDAADERSSVDLGGRRIIKKKKQVDKRGVGRRRQKNR